MRLFYNTDVLYRYTPIFLPVSAEYRKIDRFFFYYVEVHFGGPSINSFLYVTILERRVLLTFCMKLRTAICLDSYYSQFYNLSYGYVLQMILSTGEAILLFTISS
jgi:hypothetical protein